MYFSYARHCTHPKSNYYFELLFLTGRTQTYGDIDITVMTAGVPGLSDRYSPSSSILHKEFGGVAKKKHYNAYNFSLRRKTYIWHLVESTGVEIQPGTTIEYNTIELLNFCEDRKTVVEYMDLVMADYDMSVCKVGLYTDKDTPPFLYSKEPVTVKLQDDWEKLDNYNKDRCEKRLKKYKQRMVCFGKPASLLRQCLDKMSMK